MLMQYYDLPFFGLWLYLPFAYLIGIGLGLSLKTKSFKKSWGILALIALFSTLAMIGLSDTCLLYTSPSPRDLSTSRMPSSA